MFDISDYIKDIVQAEKKLSKDKKVLLYNCTDSAKLTVIARLFRTLGRTMLIVCENSEAGDRIYDNLPYFGPDESDLLFFPQTELYKEGKPDFTLTGERLVTLNSISESTPKIIVAPVSAITAKIMPKDILAESVIKCRLGDNLKIDDLEKQLADLGYTKADVCDRKGIYAKRGSLLDVFPSNEEAPVRINLDWDEISEIKYYDTESQMTVSKTDYVEIYPAREVLYRKGNNPAEKIKAQAEKAVRERKENTDIIRRTAEESAEKISEKLYFDGLEYYLPYFYEETYIWDYLPKNTVVCVCNPTETEKSLNTFRDQVLASYMQDRRKGYFTSKEYLPNNTDADFMERGKDFALMGMCVFEPAQGLFGTDGTSPIYKELLKYDIKSTVPDTYVNRFRSLIDDVKKLSKKEKIIFATSSPFRVSQILDDYEIESCIVDNDTNIMNLQNSVFVTHAAIGEGVVFSSPKVRIFSDSEVFGIRRGKKVRRLLNDTQAVKSYLDLKIGDYVVHEDYGICRYCGTDRRQVMGVSSDFLVLEFANKTLFVSINGLEKVQKYISGDSGVPKLSKIGGGTWEKTKTKAKKKIYEIAKELVELYAYRQNIKGYKYESDNRWQEELEKSFPYKETKSQLRTINEIKSDLESDRPMDRLVCGDVGFGKTEVAIRAAFKVAQAGRQVAVLVPTTVLAEQHYNSFKERLAPFPQKIELLNRFKSSKEIKESIESIKSGKSDIIIGTHRIFSKDVVFANLGLIIIDEEQRFGVKHKEKLKELKKNVDVLSLSATPIPRTLNMSLSGIRSVSFITDAPEGRMPIKTEVKPYDPYLVKNAIKDELDRGGQVFFIHNRVDDINLVADEIEKLVPEAVVDIGHGQMNEKELEEVMMDFYSGTVNVLVATTIIENGIDVSNANTIIIDNADKLGMAQLYQLRGRVGRSGRQAYAYLLYKGTMTDDGEKRLSALREFSDLGSGFRIAEKDLEIRGAGNLLGREQSGNIEGIGFEYYCRLLDEAVKELKGEKIEIAELPSVELGLDTYIPDDYIQAENVRVMFYKKLAQVKDFQAFNNIREEMGDRFGKMPEPCRNMLDVYRLKLLAAENSVSSVMKIKDKYYFIFDEGIKVPTDLIAKMNKKYPEVTFAYDRLFFDANKENIIQKATKNMALMPKILHSIRVG